MSTLAEIEQAIERLPALEVSALATWLERYRAGLRNSDTDSAQDKPFMRLAGLVDGPADLSQRKGFSGQ